MDGELSIEGIPDDLRYNGRLRIENLAIANVYLGLLQSSYRFDQERLTLQNLSLHKGKSSMKADVTIHKKGKTWSENNLLFYQIASEECVIHAGDIPFNRFLVDSIIHCTIQGEGRLSEPSIFVNTRVYGGKVHTIPLGRGEILSTITKEGLKSHGNLLDQKMQIEGTMGFSDPIPWFLEMELKEDRYDPYLHGLLKQVPEDLLLRMNCNVSLRGTKNSYQGRAVIPQLDLSVYEYHFTNASVIDISLNEKRLSINSLDLRSGIARVSIKGDMVMGESMNLTLEGRSALKPLKGFSERISRIQGNAVFSINVRGDWNTPDFHGELSIRDGTLGLKDFRYIISSISADAYMDKKRIILSDLTARVGGGSIKTTGMVYLEGFRMKEFYLDGVLENIHARLSEGFDMNLGGNVLYRGNLDKQNLIGDIQINRARYRKDIRWEEWIIEKITLKKEPSEVKRLEKTELNLHFYGDKKITIDNNIAKSDIKVDLLLRGTISSPIILGRVEAERGKVYFRSNEFSIIQGSIDFTDEEQLNPFIDLTATTRIKGYDINLALDGQIKQFNLVMSSSPHLDEVDILSLLTLGKIGSNVKGIEGGIGAGEAASLLTGRFQNVIEERLTDLTGLDRFQVSPYYSEETAKVGPQITVSKRLLSDKLYVTLSTTVGTATEEVIGEVIKVEYLLNKNISLVGDRNELGGIGGDIKFRFEFK